MLVLCKVDIACVFGDGFYFWIMGSFPVVEFESLLSTAKELHCFTQRGKGLKRMLKWLNVLLTTR